MANFSEEKVQTIWNESQSKDIKDTANWRKDVCGAWINRNEYGKESEYGWEIDHALPEAKGGTNHTDNLRAMHWKNNRSKADNFPSYESEVTSDGNKNITLKKNLTVNGDTIEKLKALYPENKFLKG